MPDDGVSIIIPVCTYLGDSWCIHVQLPREASTYLLAEKDCYLK